MNMSIENLGIEYTGKLYENDSIAENFSQAGQMVPLILLKSKHATSKLIRHQNPKRPYPYHSEEVFF